MHNRIVHSAHGNNPGRRFLAYFIPREVQGAIRKGFVCVCVCASSGSMSNRQRAAHLLELWTYSQAVVRNGQILICFLLAMISCIRFLLSIAVPGVSNNNVPPLVWFHLTFVPLVFQWSHQPPSDKHIPQIAQLTYSLVLTQPVPINSIVLWVLQD